jgi:hypothetical protein
MIAHIAIVCKPLGLYNRLSSDDSFNTMLGSSIIMSIILAHQKRAQRNNAGEAEGSNNRCRDSGCRAPYIDHTDRMIRFDTAAFLLETVIRN